MFGTYRTLLALMVVTQHIAGVHVLGAYAVFGFYILSGYLMTSVLHHNYGYNLAGVSSYALNRFLRIYPIYWVSILCSVILILLLGANYVTAYHEAMFVPRTAYEYLKNLFLFFPSVESPRLTPPAWALTVELCFYILIGLGLSKTKKMVASWLVLSLAYHLVANALNLGWNNIYFTIPAASLPFATGAFVFHFKKALLHRLNAKIKLIQNSLPVAIFVIILINWWLGDLSGYSRSICFYINYILCALMVLLLSDRAALSFIPKKVDSWLGDLSYPIYVIHYQVGLMVMAVLNSVGFAYKRPDLHILLFSLPLIILVAWCMVVCIERPIERVRSKVRPVAIK
jgi:peptidoglycan/LPS O-acetylase OafA/YrhL